MKKFVLFSILSLVLIIPVQAQKITDVDLFNAASLTEVTSFPKELFLALNDLTKKNHVGEIKAIIILKEQFNLLIMTSKNQFYLVVYNDTNWTVSIHNIDSYLFIPQIKYIVKNPECRIPNDIPNSKNSLY